MGRILDLATPRNTKSWICPFPNPTLAISINFFNPLVDSSVYIAGPTAGGIYGLETRRARGAAQARSKTNEKTPPQNVHVQVPLRSVKIRLQPVESEKKVWASAVFRIFFVFRKAFKVI